MQDAVLEQLFDARKALSALIAQATPTAGAQQAQYDQLVSERDRLTQAINGVIGSGFAASMDGLQDANTRLSGFVAQLQEAAESRENVANAIDVGAQVLQIVASVVSFVV